MAHEGLVSLPSFPSFPFFQCSRVPGKSPQFSCLDGCEVKSGWLTSLALWSLVAAPALQQVVQRYPTFATCHLWFLLALFIGGLFQSFRVQHWIIKDVKSFSCLPGISAWWKDALFESFCRESARSTSMAFRTCRLAVKREKITRRCVFFLIFVGATKCQKCQK